MIDNAKKQSYQTKIEEGKNDPRSIWKLFNDVGMKNKTKDNNSNFKVKLDDNVITNESEKVQVGKDQEKAQSEKDSHSKNRGGKKPN